MRRQANNRKQKRTRGFCRWRRDDGVAALEFGLVLPILLMLILGIIDYGFVFFTRLAMTNAAREGARVGVTKDSQGEATTEAITAANFYLSTAGLANGASAIVTGASNSTVQVTVSLPFSPLVGFVPTPASMSVVAAMRCELDNCGG